MKERGVALITAIILVAIATVLAVHIGTRAALDLRRTAGLVSLDQGWHVALGAEAWAAEVLLNDWEDDKEFDHLAEAWARPLPPLPVDGGEVRGALEDMQGRFNLNNLVDGEGSPDDAAIALFQRLLAIAGADRRWAPMMADWLDADTVPLAEGAEDGTYLSQNPPYRAANGAVSTITELMALPGMTREEYERIRPYVAALPGRTPINICTAPALVLESLVEGGTDIGDAEFLASARRDGCFPTLEDLGGRIGIDKSNQLRDSRTISQTSNWFRALTAVRIGTSELTLYSLMERNPSGASRTVLRSTGTE